MADVDIEAQRHKYFFERLLRVASVTCQTCGWNDSIAIDGVLVTKLQQRDYLHGTSLRSGYFRVLETTLLNLHLNSSPNCTNYSPTGVLRDPTEKELAREELTIVTPDRRF